MSQLLPAFLIIDRYCSGFGNVGQKKQKDTPKWVAIDSRSWHYENLRSPRLCLFSFRRTLFRCRDKSAVVALEWPTQKRRLVNMSCMSVLAGLWNCQYEEHCVWTSHWRVPEWVASSGWAFNKPGLLWRLRAIDYHALAVNPFNYHKYVKAHHCFFWELKCI